MIAGMSDRAESNVDAFVALTRGQAEDGGSTGDQRSRTIGREAVHGGEDSSTAMR